jgi:hypothetical protein
MNSSFKRFTNTQAFKQFSVKLFSKLNCGLVQEVLLFSNTDDMLSTQVLEDLTDGLRGASGYEHQVDAG